MRVVALVALVGCWVEAPPPQPPQQPQPIVAPQVAPRPRVERSRWIGQYTCPQGPTAVELTIETRGDATTAIFAFGPLDTNPTVPTGSYRMTGAKLEANGVTTYRLDPDAWIDQPEGYIMVGVVAEVVGDRMQGRIAHASCGLLEARLAR